MRAAWGTTTIAVVLSLVACGGSPAPHEERSSSDVTASVAGEQWLAAIEVAPRADDLDEATERLRGPLGPALVVSPVSCFEGLPDEAGQGYVIGALADSREAAEDAVTDAGDRVAFAAAVTILCTD
jgi:hypothetical protein